MVLRALALLVIVAGCGQSLFDNNVGGGTGSGGPDGGGGNGDGNLVVPSTCPAGCIGDAAADVGGARAGWRYLEDARNRTWAPMTQSGPGYVGAVSPNAIKPCETASGCMALPGALLVTTAGATTNADPALEFTAPSNQVVQLSVRVFVPSGQPEQRVRLYRNSREDSLYTAVATPGTLFERAISVDALAGDRFVLAIAPNGMGAADVAVHYYINSTGEVFPKECQLAVDFSTVTGHTVGNACGTAVTYRDYDLGNPDDITPTRAAGPFPELGMAADIPLTEYYTAADAIPRQGDTTTQFWMKHDAFDPSYSYNAHPFSDLDLNDPAGGLMVSIYEMTSGDRGMGVYTCDVPTQTGCNQLGLDVAYPNNASWHFVRVVHTGGMVKICIDGVRVGGFAAPAGRLQTVRKPYFGKNQVWTPSGAFFDGGLDDIRSIAAALPCDP